MTDFIKKGDDPNTAWEKAVRISTDVLSQMQCKLIDPRTDEEIEK